MAKKKAANKVMDLPEGSVAVSLEPGEERGVPTLTPPPPEEIQPEEEPTLEIQTDDPPEELIPSDLVSIEVPLRGEHDLGLGHVEARLTRPQAAILRRLQDALNSDNHRTANNRHVTSKADVVRWLLEEIEAIEAIQAKD